MKLFKYIGLTLAACSCLQFASAQQAAKLKAYVQVPGGKPAPMELERGDGKGSFFYMVKGTDQLMTASAASCKLFYIITPAEMGNALRDYYGGETAEARKQFAAIKKKYAAFAGLPGSPCTQSALHELTCAVRMLDFPAVKTLAASIPGVDSLQGSDAARVAAAKIAGMITDTPDSLAAIQGAIDALKKDSKLYRDVDTEAYSWLCYALGRAHAAQVPAEQLSGTIADDKKKAASDAVDCYCQAVMSSHGAQKSLPADALNRALGLLWAMPGVKEAAAKSPAPMDKAAWAKAPADLKDAAAMARYFKMMYDSENAGELVNKIDAYYFNAKEGTGKGD
ncbi:MAG: hypothetical protein IKA23_06215 [Akkermansia sp.]|nr:hypothetical protein [Akkermansia sp.]MBR2314990.1 hypothetical protein [Akkermansia sp.]